MTIEEFSNKFWNLVENRFTNDFPQYFVKPHAKDRETYDSANQAGYTYFNKIMNAGVSCRNLVPSLEPYYHISDSNVFDGYDIQAERERCLSDIQTCNDIRIWCFDYLPLR
jgi:hypothetical protein